MNNAHVIIAAILLGIMINISMAVDKINTQLVTVQKLLMEKGE